MGPSHQIFTCCHLCEVFHSPLLLSMDGGGDEWGVAHASTKTSRIVPTCWDTHQVKSIRAASQVTGQGKRQLRHKVGAGLKRGYQSKVRAATELLSDPSLTWGY